jgi:hypothetical protein
LTRTGWLFKMNHGKVMSGHGEMMRSESLETR